MSPLDGNPAAYAPAETKPAPDLTSPSLEGLAWVLENASAWPITQNGRRWRWDFKVCRNECGTAGCALGIAGAIWKDPAFDRGNVHDFGWMDDSQSIAVFVDGDHDPAITPAVVAGRIRDHLAGRPIRYLVEGDR